MRARYYSPEMRRFVNADIVAGKISNAITLNRFAYANNLILTVTIDFSQRAYLYEAFKDAHEGNGWIFNDMQATYSWKK